MTKNRMFTQPTVDEWEKTYKGKAEVYDKNATKLETPAGEEDVLTEKKLLDKATKEKEEMDKANPVEPERKYLKTSAKQTRSPK